MPDTSSWWPADTPHIMKLLSAPFAVCFGFMWGLPLAPLKYFQSLCHLALKLRTIIISSSSPSSSTSSIHDSSNNTSSNNTNKTTTHKRTQYMHTQRFRVLQYVCEVLLVHVFVFILPFFYSFKCLSDWLFPPKPLSHSQQQVLLRESFVDVLFLNSSLKIYQQRLAFVQSLSYVLGPSFFDAVVLRDSATACAIGNTIYLEISCDQLTPPILRHEATHCLQFYEHKGYYLSFLAEYFAEYFAHWWCNGRDADTAYRSITAELEAYANEHRKQKTVEQQQQQQQHADSRRKQQKKQLTEQHEKDEGPTIQSRQQHDARQYNLRSRSSSSRA